MSAHLPFSQLWVEEERFIFDVAAKVGNGGMIVEIGTAQGGSAFLMASATRGRNCSIYSFDVAPSAEAHVNLGGTGVHIVAEASHAGAARWGRIAGRPIDLLFVDGSHKLSDVYQDCTDWLPLLGPGAKVLFHDYDAVENGGVSHLGVRVVLGALVAAGHLTQIQHTERILSATVPRPKNALLRPEQCIEAWKHLRLRVEKLIDLGLTSSCVVGASPEMRSLLDALADHPGAEDWMERPPDDPGPTRVVVAERPLQDTTRAWISRHPKNTAVLDDLTLGYWLYTALYTRRDALLERIANRGEFFKWEEHLDMLNHATATGWSLNAAFRLPEGASIGDLSAVCAKELIRLSFLMRLKQSFVARH